MTKKLIANSFTNELGDLVPSPKSIEVMTVGELIELLKLFPKELPIVYSKYSDWLYMKPDNVQEIEVIPHEEYVEEYHENQWKRDKPQVIRVLSFPGN